MRSALAAPAVFFTVVILGCAAPSGSNPANRPVTPTPTAQPAQASFPAPDELPDSEPLGPFVSFRMSTTNGDIIFQLDNQRAPISTANFLAHAQRGNYDGTIFHRIVVGFVVQGGGFTPDLTDRAKAEGGGVSQDKPIRNEWTNGLKNLRGTIGMARDTDPDTATREFYFNLIDNSKLDMARDGTGGAGYAVFGHVVRGMNIVDSIAAIPTHEVNPEMKNVPDDIVLVTRVRRIRPPSPQEWGSSHPSRPSPPEEPMNRPVILALSSLAALGAGAIFLDEPPIITPGATAADAPSDAVVLFDGTSVKGWKSSSGGGPAAWIPDGKVGGAMTAAPGKGSIISDYTFNDAQIHVEFATPAEVHGDSQERGNSGVYIQGRYEVQVLDSHNNSTYPDGQCGAIYGQHAPLANASRAPGQWQTYDIIFHAPKFNDSGEKTFDARITLFHNGVLVQDNARATGPTGGSLSKETAQPGPLYLQEHGNTVKFRNVWIRPLGASNKN